jgi:two-component system chemotaxis response regulator CheB
MPHLSHIRVVIVDDSALIRDLLCELLADVADIEVVGVAGDPYEAREIIKQTNPDVVTLDIEMPKMDGLSFLEKIMQLRPMPVIMLSSLTKRGAEATIRALEIGAVDCIAKTSSDHVANVAELKAELVRKIHQAARARVRAREKGVQPLPPLGFHPARAERDIIAIGASTGGVEALREVLVRVPHNAPPIVIVQHMPPSYTASFAARLDTLCIPHIKEAEHNEKLLSGTVYIAQGGRHLEVVRIGGYYASRVFDAPVVSGHKPSVDVLFHSVAKIAGASAVGVILTGMGNDGAAGMRAMRDAGAVTLGQNEETCVVYGMPKTAAMAGGVVAELPLLEIAQRMLVACYRASQMEHRA